jgi:hypothetical protein
MENRFYGKPKLSLVSSFFESRKESLNDVGRRREILTCYVKGDALKRLERPSMLAVKI